MGRRPHSHRKVPRSSQTGRSPRREYGRHPDWPESGFEDLAQGGCVSAIFVLFRGRRGSRGGSLKFVKRESLSKWAVRPSFPGQRTALEWPLRRPSGLRATPGAPLPIPPSVKLVLQESPRWKVERHRPSHAVGAGSQPQGAGRKMKIYSMAVAHCFCQFSKFRVLPRAGVEL